jgi:hypothetical protein
MRKSTTSAAAARAVVWLRGFHATRVKTGISSLRCAALVAALAIASSAAFDCFAQASRATKREPYRWTKFVQVEGQPEPVPEEWVSTPEGKFAHSLKIPNPVPKDSGYRWWMTSKQHFEHLCKREAGEFIFERVSGNQGFLHARPPKWPTDSDLMEQYKLEAPNVEMLYQLLQDSPAGRSEMFVEEGGSKRFSYIEEPLKSDDWRLVVRAFGFQNRPYRPKLTVTDLRKSSYGLTWRGLRRPKDREDFIAGSEWILFELETKRVLAVVRDYALTGFTTNTPQGVWWLNAVSCGRPNKIRSAAEMMTRYSRVAEIVLNPSGDSLR